MFNINQMMKQAQNAQKKWAEEQEKFFLTEHEGSAGGGLVKATIYGNGKVKKIDINDTLLDDPRMLEDLIAAALNDAHSRKDEVFGDMQNGMMSGLNLPAGFKMPFGS